MPHSSALGGGGALAARTDEGAHLRYAAPPPGAAPAAIAASAAASSVSAAAAPAASVARCCGLPRWLRAAGAGREASLVLVLLNAALQTYVFSLLAVDGATHRYLWDLRAHDAAAFAAEQAVHARLMVAFVLRQTLLLALLLWVGVHAAAAAAQLCARCAAAGAWGVSAAALCVPPAPLHARDDREKGHVGAGAAPARGSLLWRLVHAPAAPVVALCAMETLLFLVYALESVLLGDMSVHLIDLDLVGAIGTNARGARTVWPFPPL